MTARTRGPDPWACRDCPSRHEPGSACPPPGKWLVLLLCPACDDKTGYYCPAHRGRSPAK